MTNDRDDMKTGTPPLRAFPETAEAAAMLRALGGVEQSKTSLNVAAVPELGEAPRVLRRFSADESPEIAAPPVETLPPPVERASLPVFERILDIRQTLRIGDQPRHAGANGETVREFFRRLVRPQ